MLLLDGVYVRAGESVAFRRVAAPSRAELELRVQRLGLRIGRALERRGMLVRDEERSYLDLEPKGESGLADLLGHSITYRMAVGPRAGQKVLTTPATSRAGSSTRHDLAVDRVDGRAGPVRAAVVAWHADRALQARWSEQAFVA